MSASHPLPSRRRAAPAAEIVKQAVEEDNAGHYPKALELYKQGLEWFTTHLKFEKNPHSRKAITDKVGGRALGRAGCQLALRWLPAWSSPVERPNGARRLLVLAFAGAQQAEVQGA